jgi:hypothetical protein
MKKVDMKRPYGLVNGHEQIRYEQDGLFFDWQGKLISENEENNPKLDGLDVENDVEQNKTTEKTSSSSDSETFLKQILKENPLAKSVIFDLSEKENINWSEIQEAFNSLKIVEYSNKKVWYWKLPENLMPKNA